MKNMKTKILKFTLLLLTFSFFNVSQAQDQNYLFYYGEPFAVFSKETGFTSFSLLYQDPKTEKYKLDKALAKSIKFLWPYTESKATMKFAVEKFEFDPENDACTHEAKVILKNKEPEGFYTSKPLIKRAGATRHDATEQENKLATKLVADYLRRDGYKASTIAAILEGMNVSAVSLKANEKDSLIAQIDFTLHKKFISMLIILTPNANKQLEISFSEIYSSEAESDSTHISFIENINTGDGEGDHIVIERLHWENSDYTLLSRPNKKNEWKEELSINRGC